MTHKVAYSINDQIALLKQRGMRFRDETLAYFYLTNVNYYRLRGYWWDMQSDYIRHVFKSDTFFEDVIDRYNFDRRLRLILFDAIERIEIALRTRIIYHLSVSYGGLWYLNASLFDDITITSNSKTVYQNALESLQSELDRTREVFIQEHRSRYPGQPAKKKTGQNIEKEKKNGKKTKIKFMIWSIWILAGVVISLVRGEHFFKDFYYFVCFILVPPFFIFPVLRKSVVEYISNNILDIFR